MPSVVATWLGQRKETSPLDELNLRMAELGHLSHSFLGPSPPPIKNFDHTIEGNIIVSAELFSSPPSTSKLTRISEGLYSMRDVILSGVEFRLYDGRNLYPGDDRVSFVFCLDDDPQINGMIVYVEEQEECRNYKSERIRQADYLLTVPHIHLRYYLEDWVDALMGWIKHHYFSSLNYWRHEDRWIDPEVLSGVFGRDGKAEFFESLKTGLQKEVGEWTEISEAAVQLWKPIHEPLSSAAPPIPSESANEFNPMDGRKP